MLFLGQIQQRIVEAIMLFLNVLYVATIKLPA